jgi:hypothetical protein
MFVSSGSRLNAVRFVLIVLLALGVSACAATVDRQIEALERPAGDARIVVMPLDVELFELSAAGLQEPRADWTDAARGHLLAAFEAEQAERRLDLDVLDEASLPAEILDGLHQIQSLHGAVGQTILLSRVPELALPTKQGKFDWSLGPQVAALRDATGARYALFTHIRDSYSSAGRVALIIVAGMFGVGVPGGQQVGFASLVDLETGDVVWFNRLMRGAGDLRTATAAQETAGVLLTDFPR